MVVVYKTPSIQGIKEFQRLYNLHSKDTTTPKDNAHTRYAIHKDQPVFPHASINHQAGKQEEPKKNNPSI